METLVCARAAPHPGHGPRPLWSDAAPECLPSELRDSLLRIEGDGSGVIAPRDFARPRARGRRSASIRCAFLGRDAEGQTRYVGIPRGVRGMLLLLSRLRRADGLRGLLLRFRQLLVLLFHRLQLAGKPLDDRLWFLVGGVGNARNVRPCERNCGDQSRCQRQSDQGGEPESAVELRRGGLSFRLVVLEFLVESVEAWHDIRVDSYRHHPRRFGASRASKLRHADDPSWIPLVPIRSRRFPDPRASADNANTSRAYQGRIAPFMRRKQTHGLRHPAVVAGSIAFGVIFAAE